MVLRVATPTATTATPGGRSIAIARMRALREHIAISRADAILITLALLFGVASLAFPFAHDQGVHYYVGREWLQHGALPYRDTFDYKTPGIYLLYVALIAVFGEGMWPIRLAELACIVWLGWLCARIVDEKPRSGRIGLSIFLASFAYYGFFNYWDTAQCELCLLYTSDAADE